jgi:hypothetical protein
MSLPEYITINGTNYASDKLSPAAREQVANTQIADAEIARLNRQLAIAQTARNAYFSALVNAVKIKEDLEVKPAKAKAPRKPKATA